MSLYVATQGGAMRCAVVVSWKSSSHEQIGNAGTSRLPNRR